MDKQKKIIMVSAVLAGLGLFLLSGRNASAAEISPTGETLPGGSSGSNTFTALLDKVLNADVDTSVQTIGGVDNFAGETNASPANFDGNVKISPPVTVKQPPPAGTALRTGFGGRVARKVSFN